jgi:sugar/nucleoside kinase (ribokinase family)
MVDVAVAAPALRRGGDVLGSVRLGPGGSAANVAVWAREAGAGARVTASRGDDLAGRLLAAALADRGVELHPAAPASAATGAMLVVTESGERTFVADPGANLQLATGDVTAALAGAAAVFVSGYPLLRPGTRAAALLAAKCGAGGVVVCAAASGRPRTVAAEAAEVVDVTGAGDAFAAGYLVALAGGAEPVEAAAAGNLLAARAVASVGAWPAPPA